MRSSSGRFRLAALFAILVPTTSAAQGPGPLRPTVYSFVLDLAGTPVGEIPTAIKQTKGIMEVVIKDGQPMLKASAASEFVITLPQVLPPDFTLEFEIVPKACCNPQDLSFEGTPTINQGAGSAHILWDSDGYLAIIGGGPNNYEAPMPADFQTTLPGVLTSVVAVFQGPTVRLYTNGRRLYTLDRTFARGRVLRVFLGGQDAGAHAVHLAGLRIAAGVRPPTGIAAIPVPPPGVAQPSAPSTPRPVLPPPGPPTPPPASPPPAPPPPAPPPPAPTPPPPAPPPPPPAPTPPPPAPTPPPPAPPLPPAPGSSPSPDPLAFAVPWEPPWGVLFNWTSLAGEVRYLIEGSEVGQPLTTWINSYAGPATAAGLPFAARSRSFRPGAHYQFRATAVASDGSVLATSPIVTVDAPAQYPQVTNLAATVGPLEMATLMIDGTNKVSRKVTWTFDPIPGRSNARATWDFLITDPASGQTIRIRHDQSFYIPSGFSASFEPGTAIRICVVALADMLGMQVAGAPCLDTPIPGGTYSPPGPPPPAPPSPTPVPVILAPNPAPVAGTITPITPCAPPQTSPGRGPNAVTISNQSPVGAGLAWPPVLGAVGYAVERGVTASGTKSRIATSCTDPAAFTTAQDANGNPVVLFTDRTGGVAEQTIYTYVVHAYTAMGQTGWNSVPWTSPTAPMASSVSLVATGSTVRIRWDMKDLDPITGKRVASPTDFLITSNYGFSLVKSRGSYTGCGCSIDVLGVPIGSHTFTLAARWSPDVSKPTTRSVTVSP